METSKSDSDTGLGAVTQTNRGFSMVAFVDAYWHQCSLQCSSAIGEYEDAYERPGTSAVWLGPDDAEPKIMAREAAAHGVSTQQTCGWVDYPVPDAVQMTTRMHLNREQVAGLIARLQQWLDTGKFE